MSVLKNELPILEFDTEQTAVLSPDHEKLDIKLPKKCVYAFLGEYDKTARKAIEETILFHGMNYREVVTWSTDGFFRETKEKVAYRREEGCSVVEMECSALAACAAFRNVTWGMIFYTADSLADVEQYDMRNWGGNAYEYALTLCLDAVLAL